MPDDRKDIANSLCLRGIGILLIGVGGGCVSIANAMVHTPPHHEAILAEFFITAIAFLCISGGVMLTILGSHIYDRVQISARWIVSDLSRDRSDFSSDNQLPSAPSNPQQKQDQI